MDDAPTPWRAVLVDTREDRRKLMRALVEGDGRRSSVVAEADTHDAALAMVKEQHADVVVVDIHMPLAEGLRTIRGLRQSSPRLGIIVCSFDLDKATALDALAEGADACLAKPASRHALQAAIDAACPTPPESESSVAAVVAPSVAPPS